jgi:hypothetical protein
VEKESILKSDIIMGAISDIHVEEHYDPNISNLYYCTQGITEPRNMTDMEEFVSSDPAPLGRIFCDSPLILFEKLLDQITFLRPNLNVLFVTGDFIGHGMGGDRKSPYSDEVYQDLLDVHKNISDLLNKKLPNVIVIPTFGNNDFYYHNEPANETSKA